MVILSEHQKEIKMSDSLYILFKYWRKHKKSLSALLFSGVLLCAVVCCAFLMIRQEQRRWLENYYDGHGAYTLAVPSPGKLDEMVGLVSTDETVSGEIYVTGVAGVGRYKYQIGTIDDPMNLAHIPLETGRMPQSSDEIAIDRGVLNKFGFFGSIGDNITIDTGTYRLVGIIDENYGMNHPGSLLHEQRFQEEDMYNIEENTSKKYMPLLFTCEDSSNAQYKWVMLDKIKNVPPKTISSPADEMSEYLRSNGFDYDSVADEAGIYLWDFYNYKPAIAKLFLIGYDSVRLSAKTRMLLVLTGISVIIAVLSVVATLRNIFAERENSMRMLRRIGFSKKKLILLYMTECFILIVIQTFLGMGIGSGVHLLITRIETGLLEKRNVTGFTLDPLVTDISFDPFVISAVISAAVLIIGYLTVGCLVNLKERTSKKKKAGSLRNCIARMFRSRAVTVIQTAALTLICFGTLFGYMLYHNTTGDYFTDEQGNIKFYKNISTTFGSSGQFDLEEDNVKEYYFVSSSPDVSLGNFELVKTQEEYYGIDDNTPVIENTIMTGKLSQTFLVAKNKTALKHELVLSADERAFISENSSEEGKVFFGLDQTYYKCPTVLADAETINSLSQYAVSGEICTDKLSTGEEMLLVIRSGDVPLNTGDIITVGSAATSNGFGINDLKLSDTRVGAVIVIPKEVDRILKYAVSAGDDYSLLTTAAGAENLGIHAAKYTEIFAGEPIGRMLPTGLGFEVISLEQQRHEMFVRNAEQYVSMGLLILLMSLLGFAAYFNGIGMKIRLKEYQISVMRAIGSPVKKLRRKMTFDSVGVPIVSAAFAYGLMKLTQNIMLTAFEKANSIYEQAISLLNDGDVDKFEILRTQSDEINQRFMTGTQMWYVNALIPTLIIFSIMCIVTIILTRRSFKMFTPDIAEALARGRKRR